MICDRKDISYIYKTYDNHDDDYDHHNHNPSNTYHPMLMIKLFVNVTIMRFT